MIGRLNDKLEKALYRRGYQHADVRRLVRYQVLILMISCGLAAPVALWSPKALHFAAGVILISLNFFSLAKFGQHIAQVKKGAVLALLFRFYVRLLLTGLALFGLIVWAGADIFALLAGLSTVVLSALVFGIHLAASRATGKTAKEA